MRLWLCAGAANGFVSVAVGAFSAHSPLEPVTRQAMGWIETGVDYQMAHALALLAVAWLEGRLTGRGLWTTVAGWSFLAGTILFSGTLYVMALTGVTAIGAAVPVGGAAFLVGWAALFVCGLRKISGSTGE
ncbi:MAG: DUF423 domain-containing protein [Kiloniellales bacterium]|jgi:uncharacterized membrane protein YgdD (TMEM256/DUF423 family)